MFVLLKLEIRLYNIRAEAAQNRIMYAINNGLSKGLKGAHLTNKPKTPTTKAARKYKPTQAPGLSVTNMYLTSSMKKA